MRKEIFNREMISAKEDKSDIDFDALRRELRDFRAREVLLKDDINLVLQFLNDQDREVYWEANGRLNELKEEIGILTQADKKKEQAWVAEHSLLDKTYKNILERAAKETRHFQELHQAGLLTEFLNHFEQSRQGKVGSVKIEWNSPKMFADSRYKNYGGIYSETAFNKRIYMRNIIPSETDILRSLSDNGYMPKPASTFFHEWIHSAQGYSALEKLLHYEFLVESKTELDETHARRSDLYENSGLSKRQFVERLKGLKKDDGSPLYDLNDGQLIVAVTLIDQLRALNFSPHEIGKLIKRDGWYFQLIQKTIERKCRELGIDEDDLENLVHADKMKREIERLKVKLIAQEELKKIKDNYINR